VLDAAASYTSETWGNLGGSPGPEVTEITVPASGNVLVTVTAAIAPNAAHRTGSVSFSSNGACPGVESAEQVAASTERSLHYAETGGAERRSMQASATYPVHVKAGSHAFRACYDESGGSVEFKSRSIVVQPLP
jgi:hypothetical protein